MRRLGARVVFSRRDEEASIAFSFRKEIREIRIRRIDGPGGSRILIDRRSDQAEEQPVSQSPLVYLRAPRYLVSLTSAFLHTDIRRIRMLIMIYIRFR